MNKAILMYESRYPQPVAGIPWVYFSCYPDSFEKWKDTVKRDVLQCCDCVLCYRNKEQTLKLPEAELSQMTLFVFAVDKRFIEKDCVANQEEWNFALQHRIPILPLIMEDGLLSDFNQRFGSLHTLMGIGSGRQEKLPEFFERLFVGEKLREEIRKAFDAYIFLSYRKVDASDALELIKSIHSLDFCRDIAVWFDSYLVPGEDFNEGIRTALERCDLFTLLVTPSLLKENNYVRRIEFPEAVKAKKQILPVEMRWTDRAKLEDWFIGVPECTDGHQLPQLSNALRERLKNIAFQKNQSPRHNYCIGLAYLQGIDTEVDKTKAAELITTAAEAGLQEAMKALISMYRTGNGVEIDWEMAAFWHEKLAKSYKPKNPKLATIQKWQLYVQTCIDAAESYSELWKYDEAYTLLFQAHMDFACNYNTERDPAKADLILGRLHANMGFVMEKKANRKQALLEYAEAAKKMKAYPSLEKNSECLCEYAFLLKRTAGLLAADQNTEEIRNLSKEAEKSYTKIWERNHSYESGIGYVGVCLNLCRYELDHYHQDAALAYLNRSSEVLQQVKDRYGTGRTLEEQVEWGFLEGDCYFTAHDYDNALKAYQGAEAAGNVLLQKYITMQNARNLAGCTAGSLAYI